MNTLFAALLHIFVAFFTVVLFTQLWWRHKKLPPGPWGLPIVGHLLFLGLWPHKTIMTWKKKYGPIIYCRMGSFPCVFLCDSKVIREAFAKPELSGRGDFEARIEKSERKGITLSEGPRQEEQRRWALKKVKDIGNDRSTTSITKINKTTKRETYIQEAVCEFLNEMQYEARHKTAIATFNFFPGYVIAALQRILMTQRLYTPDANFIETCAYKTYALGSTLSNLAIFMPWMETLIKLVTFGRVSLTAERVNSLKEVYQFIRAQIDKRSMRRVKGHPRDAVDAYLDMVDKESDENSGFHPSHNSVAHFAGDLMLAGVHSISLTLQWAFLYLASCPSIQKKMQKEIGLVLPFNRLANVQDRVKLPYVDAVICEILRLSSIFPLGLDHKSLADVTLGDFHIPKGTVIFANMYGIHHDPEIWGPDVEEFKPERWLGKAGAKLRWSDKFRPFSTGKRSCFGETLAQETLFLFITGIFQQYCVALEDGGSDPGFEPRPGFAATPPHFKVVLSQRHLITDPKHNYGRQVRLPKWLPETQIFPGYINRLEKTF